MQRELWHKSFLEISNTELKKNFGGWSFFQAKLNGINCIFQKKYPMLAHAVMLSHSDVVSAWQRVQREPGNGRQSESSGLLQTIKFVSSPIDSIVRSYFSNMCS